MLFLVTSIKGLVGSRDGEFIFEVRTTKAVTAGRSLSAKNFIQKNALFLGNDVACMDM